jgi:hypothetical protein
MDYTKFNVAYRDKVCQLSKQRCFFQSLYELALKLKRNKQNVFNRKQTDLQNFQEIQITLQPMYCGMIFKPNFINCPCIKYFTEVSDMLVCLCRNACDKYESDYKTNGFEILNKLQKEVIFFDLLQKWALTKTQKCSQIIFNFSKIDDVTEENKKIQVCKKKKSKRTEN